MSLEKITQLASIEILFPSRGINAAWHTSITENGVVISGPSIHRKAFPQEDISEILPEVSEFVSGDYVKVLQQLKETEDLANATAQELNGANATLQQKEDVILALQANVDNLMLANQEQAAQIQSCDARIAELEQALAEAMKPAAQEPQNG